MSNHVDKVGVTVSGFYKELSVQSFELIVAINSIPQITLNVLPIETPKKGNGQYITASSPNIQDITQLYSELLSGVTTLDKKATITIKHSPPSSGVEYIDEERYQTVTLKDWIMSDVGLSTITATGAPMLAIIFSHPVVMLDRTGAIYENVENPLELNETYSDISASNVIEYMDEVYDILSSGDDIEFTEIAQISDGGPDDRFKSKIEEFRTQLSEYKPSKYIEDKTGKLYLEEINPEISDALSAMIGPMVAPTAFCGSTWNRLITEICPQFLTAIIPKYDKEKLVMEPYSPWQNCSYTIDIGLVSSVDVVPLDPNPIIGTAIIKDPTDDGAVIDKNVQEYSDSEYDKSYAFYFPDLVLEDPQIKGGIMNLGEPPIISNLNNAITSSNSIDGMNGEYGEDLEDAGGDFDEEDREELDEVYAKAMFILNYRRNCKASVVTIPFFSPGNSSPMYPGRVLTVRDKDNEVNLFYGYITRIITKGESSGSCMSIFELTHARPAYDNKSITKILIDEGTENPCYPVPDRSDY